MLPSLYLRIVMSSIIKRLIAGFKANPSELEAMVIKRDFRKILDDMQTSTLTHTDIVIDELGIVLGESPTISFAVCGYHEIFSRMKMCIEPLVNQKSIGEAESPYKLEELKYMIIKEGSSELWWQFLFVYWVDVVYFNGSNLKLMQKIANTLTGRTGTWLHIDMHIYWSHFLAHNNPRCMGFRRIKHRATMEMLAPHMAFYDTKIFLQEDGMAYSGHKGKWIPYEVWDISK